MANINQMVQSKYLKGSDVPDPIIVTVAKVGKVNMAKEDEQPEMKWAIRFQELQKPMVLNATNIHIAAKVLGSDDTDDWMGKEIVLYFDPNVSFGGQLVGGLRFRGIEKPPAKAIKSDGGLSEMDDSIPF